MIWRPIKGKPCGTFTLVAMVFNLRESRKLTNPMCGKDLLESSFLLPQAKG